MLSPLQEQYRRIQLLKTVHGTPEIKKQTATVYRLGIEFLHEAVRYYSIGTFRRICHIISKPPSIHLQAKVSEIQGAIEEIRKEIETLDAVRLEKVEQAVTELSEDVGDLRQRIESVNLNVRNIGQKANGIDLRVEGVEKGMEGMSRLMISVEWPNLLSQPSVHGRTIPAFER
jgi:methyl-accepting chemotaxis protein